MKAAAARFDALSSARSTALHNAREASRLTIPGLIPVSGQNEHYIHETPYQSVGSDGVRSLSSRLLMVLFPHAVPFFRCEIDAPAAKALGDDKAEVDVNLADFVDTTQSLFEESGARPIMAEAIRQLVIAGNVLVYIPMDEEPRLYRLDQYVVKRNHRGSFSEIIVKETIYPSTLPDDVRLAVGLKLDQTGDEKTVDQYFVVERFEKDVTPPPIFNQRTPVSSKKEAWVRHWQEINGRIVPGSQGESPADVTGWLPLRWLAVPGSDYGRSHVTEFIGDIISIEDANKSIIQMASAAARILYLVDPSSGIDRNKVAKAISGDVFEGNAQAISSVGLDKSQDFSVVRATADTIERRVNRAFLVNAFDSNAGRDRVTAEEVRLQSEELNSTLSGAYSTLANELQLPVANRYLYIASRRDLIPELPAGIKRKVVTGLAALGQAAEVTRLRTFVSDVSAVVGQGAVAQYFNIPTLLKTLGLQHGVRGIEGLLKSEEQQAQEQQQAQMAQLAQQMAPDLASAAVNAATGPATPE